MALQTGRSYGTQEYEPRSGELFVERSVPIHCIEPHSGDLFVKTDLKIVPEDEFCIFL